MSRLKEDVGRYSCTTMCLVSISLFFPCHNFPCPWQICSFSAWQVFHTNYRYSSENDLKSFQRNLHNSPITCAWRVIDFNVFKMLTDNNLRLWMFKQIVEVLQRINWRQLEDSSQQLWLCIEHLLNTHGRSSV